ncbi:MFS transporter [Novosphingobium terrae]|uniref:MFS transporter n=1 Tax=Novosphingobium terrae TaxID=2726189 RepID=UPI001F12AB07|nr:MFS transporter [Novosphingobium terrae]
MTDQPRSPAHIPDYRRFWLTRFCSWLAGGGMAVIIGYQLYDVARQDYHMSIAKASFQLGIMGFCQFVPMFLLSPVAGVIADRFDKRNVGLMSIAVDLVVAASLWAATGLHALSLPLLFGLGALHGLARVFIGPSIGSMAPLLVPPALLPRAVAMNSMAMQLATIIGPAGAGLLFAVHPTAPYMGAVILLAIGFLSMAGLRRLPPHAGSRDQHPIRQIAEGFTFVWNNRFLLGCITLDLFAVLFGGATALLPVFARDILHAGPEGLGQMRAATAVGASLMGIVLTARPISQNVGVKMLVAVGVFGAITVAFGLSTNYFLSLGLLAVLGAADMISVFVRSTLVQLHTPDEMRGRLSAISGLAISASNELGEMESGLAAALLGATGAVVMGGIGAMAITVLWAVFFPQIRRARTFSPHLEQG